MADRAPKLLLVDDHPMLREGLRRSLVGAGYEVIGEAGDGQAAIEQVEALRPDLVLMDVTMPVLGGIEATKKVVERRPGTAVLMLTMHADPQLSKEAIEAGAMGYLVKDCTTEDITSAIDRALSGEQTFPEESSTLIETGPSAKPLISQREAEVLQMIANGKSTTEAAKELYVSAKTVKNHLAACYAKLDAHDRTQAVLRAARLGLIKLDS